MKLAVGICACLILCACGVETAGTAATSATLTKQQLDSGKKTLERVEQKLGQSLELQQQRAASTTGRADK